MKHFNFAEFLASDTARRENIKLTLNEETRKNIALLVDNILDPAREQLGSPITITSGYRNEALNKAVGGAKGSHHLYGQAADITSTKLRNDALLQVLKKLPYYELIAYREKKTGLIRWIHVSYVPEAEMQLSYSVYVE